MLPPKAWCSATRAVARVVQDPHRTGVRWMRPSGLPSVGPSRSWAFADADQIERSVCLSHPAGIVATTVTTACRDSAAATARVTKESSDSRRRHDEDKTTAVGLVVAGLIAQAVRSPYARLPDVARRLAAASLLPRGPGPGHRRPPRGLSTRPDNSSQRTATASTARIRSAKRSR